MSAPTIFKNRSWRLPLAIKNPRTGALSDLTGATIVFRIKATPAAADPPILELSLGSGITITGLGAAVVEIPPDALIDIDAGVYVYDCQCTLLNDDFVQEVVQPTKVAVLDALGSGGSSESFVTSFDAKSKKLVPATSLEWETLLGALGIVSGGTPTSIWNFQEAASPIVDVNGLHNLNAVTGLPGSLTFQNTIDGWTRLGAGVISNGTDTGFSKQHGGLPSPDTVSYMALAYVRLEGDATETGCISLLDGAYYTACKAGTRRMSIGSASGQASVGGRAMAIGEVFPIVIKHTIGQQSFKVYTPYDVVNGGYTTPTINTGEIVFGCAFASGIRSATAKYLYGAMFLGAAAEWTDADIATLLLGMGWDNISWASAPAKDSSKGVYTPCARQQWLALKIPPPTNVWPLQETAGIIANDFLSDIILATSLVTPGASSPDMSRFGWQVADSPNGGANNFIGSTDSRLVDPATTSQALLVYVDVLTAASGSAPFWSWVCGVTQQSLIAAYVTSAGVFGLYQNPTLTLGTVAQKGTTIPVIVMHDVRNQRQAVYTPGEKIVGAGFTARTGKGVYIGSGAGVPSAGAIDSHAVHWTGPQAEMSDAVARDRLQKLGWTVAW